MTGLGRGSRPGCALGFTLIELLVVLTLLALLLGIAVPRYLHTVDASREKVRATPSSEKIMSWPMAWIGRSAPK